MGAVNNPTNLVAGAAGIFFEGGGCSNVIGASLNLNFEGGLSKCSVTRLLSNAQSASSVGTLGLVSMNTSSSSLPFDFSGKIVSSKISKKSGEITETIELVDQSYVLDQKNIILFRRAFCPSKEVIKTKIVRKRILKTKISYSGTIPSSINFTWEDVDRTIASSVLEANGPVAGATVLGSEEYTSDPCSIPSSTYSIAEALATIGVTANSVSNDLKNMRVSYEGTHRSVLSSICNDLGLRWRYDNGDRIQLIDASSVSDPVPSETDGCGILSYTTGQTLEGTFSQSSIVFYQKAGFSSSAPQKQISGYQEMQIDYELPNGASKDDLIKEALYASCPSLEKYDLMMAQRWEDLGYKVLARISFNFSDEDFVDSLRESYNLKEDVPITEALASVLNIRTPDHPTREFPSSFLVVAPYPEGADAYQKRKKDESRYGDSPLAYLYYPVTFYDSDVVNSSSSFISRKKITIDPTPQYQLRNGKLKRGYFESISTNVYGDTDASEFDQATAESLMFVGGELFTAAYTWLLDSEPGSAWTVMSIETVSTMVATKESVFKAEQRKAYIDPENEKSLAEDEKESGVTGYISTLKKNIENGAQLCVYFPPNTITVSEGANVDQDTRELTIDLIDRKTIEVTGLDGKEFSNPCKNIEDTVFSPLEAEASNQDTTTIKLSSGKIYTEEVKREGDPIKKTDPSLLKYTISCAGQTPTGYSATSSASGKNIYVEIGGLLPYRAFLNYDISYSAAFQMSNPKPEFISDIQTGSGGLESSVLITDVSNDSFEDNDDSAVSNAAVPAVSFTTPIQMASFECNGFNMSATNTSLRSISATYSSGQTRVRYEYQQYPPKPAKIIYKRRVPIMIKAASS